MKHIDQKILKHISDELKTSAEQILKCDLVLVQSNIKDGFFPIARFADNKPRHTEDKNFILFKGKKCFSKKIGKFEYLLEIIDLS
ncbi:hypothetical protein [Campylobacter sp. CCUG 57310]|uniref:hypothetical protein n=1 Tax=Campylobacter sp. CCUG 57310 TaxID=2517362 RepID=UPI001566FB39|nr:hypothetical protein [Campylobacter sp. CCUG 57310]QKF93187.1 hypothetical protein CORI_a001 [Campylobacter sp. CCUG 57310]